MASVLVMVISDVMSGCADLLTTAGLAVLMPALFWRIFPVRLRSLISPESYIRRGKQLLGIKPPPPKPLYEGDGMKLYNKNVAFMRDERFMSAYRRGMDSGHHIARPKGSHDDLHIEFRAHVECWAAAQALLIEGDFVCCGVNTGIFPLAICQYLDFNSTGRNFWLFDTYEGIPVEQASERERSNVVGMNATMYSDVWEVARQNFAPFPKAHLVRGRVPATLDEVTIHKVAYLAIDMNIAMPERAAIEHFWPKLSPGALVVLDDYAFVGHDEQHDTMDEFATSVGVSILTLPTGQGMLKKPS